jgi:hypothetical protein
MSGLSLALAAYAFAAVGCGTTAQLTLTTQVTEQGTGLPIPNATVTVHDDTKDQAVAIQPNATDDNGNLTAVLTPQMAPPGHQFTVSVSAPGYSTASKTFQASSMAGSQNETIAVALTPTQPHLTVTVEDASNHRGIVAAAVSVTPADAQPPVTDSAGVSFFALNANTTYTVTASKTGFTSASTTVSFDKSNAGQSVTLLLTPQAPLIVKAVDVSTTPNQPIAGATVNVATANGALAQSGQTGADGGVTFQVDTGNTYFATAQAQGFILSPNQGPAEVTFPPGSTQAQTITLQFIKSGVILPPR